MHMKRTGNSLWGMISLIDSSVIEFIKTCHFHYCRHIHYYTIQTQRRYLNSSVAAPISLFYLPLIHLDLGTYASSNSKTKTKKKITKESNQKQWEENEDKKTPLHQLFSLQPVLLTFFVLLRLNESRNWAEGEINL